MDERGVMVSQVGYDVGRPMRAVVRGPSGMLADGAGFTIDGKPAGRLAYWGERWHAHWWVADLGAPAAGTHVLGVPGFEDEPFDVGEGLLFARTWRDASIVQAEARARFAMNKVGWQDCGAAWQEANSHAAYVMALADFLNVAGGRIGEADRARIVRQIENGSAYLALLQDIAPAGGHDDGALVHQKGAYQGQVMARDALQAALAWLTARAYLPAEYVGRARRAIAWALSYGPQGGFGWSHIAHGTPEGYEPPAEWMTRDLLTLLMARVLLGELDAAAELAETVMARQVLSGEVYGHFRTFATGELTEPAWTHSIDKSTMGVEAAGHFQPDVMALVALSRAAPGHAAAPRWRAAIERYVAGYLRPGCASNPFGLVPNGHYPGEGFIHFAGTWHGINCVYGYAAMATLELSKFLGDASLEDLAVGNLQWLAGVNAGVTIESMGKCHVWSMPIEPGRAVGVSMINGIGRRTGGTWFNVRGSVCNGFSAGEQFRYDVAVTRANDAPSAFTDEDWIPHSGAWLSAVARL